ncbi:hypothetical protein GGS21DRAFT_53150 [Xylaria nigripes]|nr:hypothetical protein GGS21DRAFT_53150 [Xylaria nigripes]
MASVDAAQEMETFDVLVVGAGVSGINAAYRLRTKSPGATFAVLEGRGDIGGTWDLFRYPGIRSDSDLFTYAFQWEQWPYETPIAEGALIKEYMKNCVKKHDLARYIRFHHKVHAVDWSKEEEAWTVTVEHEGRTKYLRANWVLLGTGYYDYDKPARTTVAGIDNFKGTVIHPQYWPQDWDYSGKKIIVVGSGATAITLLPALSKKAESVTIVQRSPPFVASLTNKSPSGSGLYKFLSKNAFGTFLRIQYLWFQHLGVLFCHYFPKTAYSVLTYAMKMQLPARISSEPHFKPAYNPWEQRLCLAPDGDFFTTLRENPSTHIVTGHIDTVTESGLRMEDGTTVEADAIITATGLHMRLGGNIAITVNGETVDMAGRLLWHGSMIENVPNLMLSIGYVDNSWTLGADDTVHILTRLFNHMKSKGISTAIPRPPPEGTGGTQRMWRLTSTYSETAQKTLPVYGKTGPWRPKVSPPRDWVASKWGDILTGLHFSP